MKPVRLLKKLAATAAAGLLALGLTAGTPSVAAANSSEIAATVTTQDGNSNEIGSATEDNSNEIAYTTSGNSNEIG
ncbi:hypothetical protein [Glycomyces xiaoerkulensis]|uniref:hypothetical protein n=1 Tax=Glycomyces xiaoerkulensis TaxID=2038139 RepID=UPI000C25B4C1|nr:hypothetical protein [Glycomyces xiaoerkulensis]